MARRKKLSRKQLKRDAFVEEVFVASEFFQENWQKMLTYIAIVLGVILLFYGGKYYLQTTKTNASNMLVAAVKHLEDGNYTAAKDSLQLLEDGFFFSNLTEDAKYYQAEVLYRQAQYGEAEKKYNEYLEKFGYTAKYSIVAAVNQAVCLEQQNQPLPAAEKYLKLIANTTNEKLHDFIKNEAVRCLYLGKSYADAERIAQELLNAAESEQQRERVRLLIGEIKGAQLEAPASETPVELAPTEATPTPIEITPASDN